MLQTGFERKTTCQSKRFPEPHDHQGIIDSSRLKFAGPSLELSQANLRLLRVIENIGLVRGTFERRRRLQGLSQISHCSLWLFKFDVLLEIGN